MPGTDRPPEGLRLSDLLRYRVRTADGRRLGQVSDVRVVQDGPMIGTQSSFRIDALVVGKAGLAERLGYVRNRVRGPWLLSSIFAPLERRAVVVRLVDVESWDEQQLTVTVAAGARIDHPS